MKDILPIQNLDKVHLLTTKNQLKAFVHSVLLRKFTARNAFNVARFIFVR